MGIREYKLEDYTAVITLWRDAGLELNSSDSFEGLQLKLTRDPDLFLVVEEDGQIMGALLAGFDGRRCWIYQLAVHPFGQRKGWGKKLLAELETRVKAKGCIKINSLVEPSYASSKAFFERRGYKEDQLIFMEKWL